LPNKSIELVGIELPEVQLKNPSIPAHNISGPFPPTQFFTNYIDDIVSKTLPNKARWIPRNNSVCINILGHHSAGADYGSVSNIHSWQDYHRVANPDAIPDYDFTFRFPRHWNFRLNNIFLNLVLHVQKIRKVIRASYDQSPGNSAVAANATRAEIGRCVNTRSPTDDDARTNVCPASNAYTAPSAGEPK
jgi:hypothetical protein